MPLSMNGTLARSDPRHLEATMTQTGRGIRRRFGSRAALIVAVLVALGAIAGIVTLLT